MEHFCRFYIWLYGMLNVKSKKFTCRCENNIYNIGLGNEININITNMKLNWLKQKLKHLAIMFDYLWIWMLYSKPILCTLFNGVLPQTNWKSLIIQRCYGFLVWMNLLSCGLTLLTSGWMCMFTAKVIILNHWLWIEWKYG